MLFIFLSFNQKIIIITLKHTNRTNIKSGKNQKKKLVVFHIYTSIRQDSNDDSNENNLFMGKNSEQLNLTRFSYSDFNCDSHSCTNKYYKQKKRKTITIKIGDISSFRRNDVINL